MTYIVLVVLISMIVSYLIFYKYYKKKKENQILSNIQEITSKKDDLEKCASNISEVHGNTEAKNSRRKLIKSLDKSYNVILKAYEYIDRDVRNKKEIVPGAEWLLDNLYFIEKEYKDIKQNIPYSYYKNLPTVSRGIFKGYPRIYHIALEIVAHTDGKVDESSIERFINIYQKNNVLTVGELWAMPIMIKIALIQNISKTVEKMVFAQREKSRAERIANRIINSMNNKDIETEVNKLRNEDIIFTDHFCERLLKILRDNAIDNVKLYKWIDERLGVQGLNSEKMINSDHNKQINFQLSMGNCIIGIREVEGLNWKESFDKLNYLESILKEDPALVYPLMDFESRDYYRSSVEKIARNMGVSECYVGKKAIECAKESKSQDDEEYKNHVGYYIVDDGLSILKDNIGLKDRGLRRIVNYFKRHSFIYYSGTIIIGTLAIMALVISFSIQYDSNFALWRYILAAILILIPCSEIVISIFNWSVNNITEPSFIPKLDLAEGIDKENSTIVVIPTILNNAEKVKEIIEDIEVYYLANCEKNLYFALLGDFKDSTSEFQEDDEEILKAGLHYIENLNKKYCENGEEIFYFFNRFRKYNSKEKKWMGWERKRGKLVEFNKLLRGDKNTSYNTISGDINNLTKVKYVITLDADTQLIRGSAKKLIGAMSHILNRPVIYDNSNKVIRGYGLMQPRIGVSTLSANKTLFSKIFSGETGIDTYTSAVSDVYQDLFGEGIFTGKGIYDIDVFNKVLENEIPENAVLSHDLLEGCYLRTALVTDIELIDGYPSNYLSNAKRVHRWVRGDWQLLPWIKKNPKINAISRWKMIDNLRRSLLLPSIMILIALSFNVLPNGTDKWVLTALLALICPILFNVSEVVVSSSKGLGLSGKIENSKRIFEQVFLIFCFLPYMAYMNLDAIIRTLYRLSISKKNLLEWQTAADVEATQGNKALDFVKSMLSGCIISIIVLFLAFRKSTSLGFTFLPSSIVWLISPFIAYFISQDREVQYVKISDDMKCVLRKLSRKSWAYFEDFVNENSNWLAPDNYQEHPNNGVIYNTSPTNMAMGITSNIVAFDLGYIGILQFIERINNIISSMEDLEKYNGHFFNWYNSKTKEPLKPKYISTVDSGNLLGYLWLTSSALDEYKNKPLFSKNKVEALVDLLNICDEEIEKCSGTKGYYSDIIKEISKDDLDIEKFKEILFNILDNIDEDIKGKKDECLYWLNKIKRTSKMLLLEINTLLPSLDECIDNDIKLEDIDYLYSNVAFVDLSDELENIICKLDDDNKLSLQIKRNIEEINKNLETIDDLKNRLEVLVNNMNFDILYNKKKSLFSIGYNVDKDKLDKGCYDLLASESRQASFIAIAKGDVDQKHWFKLGRAIMTTGKNKCLVSWSGTMFEYFMPFLIMKNYPDTLLNETYSSVVQIQKNYCKTRRVPWGISESAFYSFDTALNYQYKAFGVPIIGLKRGLINELVISPYSTIIAMQFDLKGAFKNINRFINEGMEGRYGLYESIDYTNDRLPKGKKKEIVKSYMVHHKGMSLMAIDNVLNNNILQERFHSIPKVKATELLLQEKVPKRIIYNREQPIEFGKTQIDPQSIITRVYKTAKTDIPETHLLSNGTYSLMISNSGSGYGKKEDMTVYRWKEDVTLDSGGMYFYIKDVNANKYWSSTYEPCKCEGDDYNVIFSLDKVQFKRRDGDLKTKTEIAVSNEDNAEIRKVSITNESNETKIIEITSYAEVTLTTYESDIVHPAFSNLFIRTEFVEDPLCIIANRRPRAKGQNHFFTMQTVAVQGDSIGTVQYETSRVNFIGRNRDISNPIVLENDKPLSNTLGAVLDPIISIRKRVKIRPNETSRIVFTTAVGSSKDEVLKLARKYSQMHNIKRVFQLALIQSQIEMKYFGIKSPQANLYQIMASKILFLNNTFRDRDNYIKNIKEGQSSLWGYGISGDFPIVLVIVKNEKDIDKVKQLLKAHEYWSAKGLNVDLVILNSQESSYMQNTMDLLKDLVYSSYARVKMNKQGGIFLQSIYTMSSEVIKLLKACARLVIDCNKGELITQITNNNEIQDEIDDLQVKDINYHTEDCDFNVEKLKYYNDIGGFDTENDEYVIVLNDMKDTPAPWINIISNKDFGFHVSEGGSSYTWCSNSRENKITPWSNDWITDMPGEALYLRDEVNGKVWSISTKPVRDDGKYIIRHGFGYSNFKHNAHGIVGEMTVFVPKKEKVKICLIKLKNDTSVERKLSLTYYAHLNMGVVPQFTSQYISTYLNEKNKYIYAKNPYDESFGEFISYLKIIGGENESFTGNRKEFIGRGGNVKFPKALKKVKLSNMTGAGMDPCLAENSIFKLNPYEEVELVVMLGEEKNIEDIDKVIGKYGEISKAKEELRYVKEYWKSMLKSIQVKTPDKSMDILLNGWLMYQTIACRMWARTAFYQSGGAYGFRDQLQDTMSINYLNPEITRSHILYSASRQFIEGDVQHWWHPIVDSGIRTRFSDDLLWLPYVTADYIKNTGDYDILHENVGYLEEEPLKEDEDERYNIAGKSEKTGTIYEHCIKSIERALKFGIHNIPLMGSGDWNDGMSNVGNKGKGESVWLAWFLYSILDSFIEICKYENDIKKSERYAKMQQFIRENIEDNAWDGSWYRRAYFDDGTPLGSMENDECQIDSISQSWAVISGGGDEERVKVAMNSLEKYLIKEDKGMVMLLTPPFDKSILNPGYIKGYVPGVRENGGQYTHSVAWVILALIKMGQCNKAWKIYNMINPINHTKSRFECEIYKVEPYVMAADVYAVEPHVGRGGWTWYTGAAGWMYRVGIEGIIGLQLKGGKGFNIKPCIPDSWNSYEIVYKNNNAVYNISVKRGENKEVKLDGKVIEDGLIPFFDNGVYNVEVII